MTLIDTTPLVALCDRRDSHHRRATRQLDALRSTELVTCEPVLVEACFHLPNGRQRQRLQALLEALRVTPLPQGDEPGFWDDVFSWLVRYAEHEPDWADACIAVLAGRHAQLRVWTFDREFRTTWRRPDGTPIPLAPE